jgi:hypothetical protein
MRVLLEARFSCPLVHLTHAACAECSVPVSCAKDHRSEAEGQGERQSQRYRCILQVRGMLPLEQPKQEEDNTWQVTQARIGCHTKEAALLFGVKPIKVLVHSIVHIDADEPFRDGVQSDPVRFVEVASIAVLIAFPVKQTWTVVGIVLILELFFENWSPWRRRSRFAVLEVIHLVVNIWECEINTCASPESIFVKEDKL